MRALGGSLPQRLLATVVALVVMAVLAFWLWPTPNALVTRWLFTGGGERVAAQLESRVPDGIASRLDLAYGDDSAERLDVYRRESADGPLPTIVWVHGGGWVGGDKTDVRPYLKILASRGYTVIGINYSRAPGKQYPTPVRQLFAALSYVQRHASDLGVDPDRIVLGGDSAGAQIAAQGAALVTNPGYARSTGLTPTLEPDALRGTVLYCGSYDPSRVLHSSGGGVSGHVARMVVRSYLDEDQLDDIRVADHVTDDFPPTWISAGNADPLESQSHTLAAALEDAGVDLTTLFFPADHRPALGHEYQFALSGADAQRALDETETFLADVLPAP